MHTIRRNPDITNLVHNNMVYGLTKGQATPTSQIGFTTPVQVDGVFAEPFNPIAAAIALDASFIARAYIGDKDKTKDIIKQAVRHKGFALVDIFQPCVVYNKINTYKWFKDHTYYLEDTHDPHDKVRAFKRALEQDKLPLGVFYSNPNRKTFEENLSVYQMDKTPLPQRRIDRREDLNKFLAAKQVK
jgi:2-oxoglutarate ferredoxin oxidoreductase subunit beta